MYFVHNHSEKETKRKESKLRKLEIRRGILQQIPMNCRGSLGNVLETYIPIHWKT
jgi:hypothetical protein